MDVCEDNIVMHLGKQIILASEITRNDVLCGRGGSINTNPGNERFRKLVDSKKRLYLTARFKREKRLIASNIVAEIHALNPPGRFLAKVPDAEAKKGERGAHALAWYEVDLEKARDKTSQALREGAPVIRKEMEDEIVYHGTTNMYEDDYEDHGAYGSEDEFDNKSKQICNPTQNYSNYFWRQPFDTPTASPWNSFRDLATNVAAAATSFSPYFATNQNDEQIPSAPHLVVQPSTTTNQQHLHPPLPTHELSSANQGMVGVGQQIPPFYYGNHGGEMTGHSEHYSHQQGYPSSAAVTVVQPTESPEFHWRKVPDHPSMLPPRLKYQENFDGQFHQSTPTSLPVGGLPVPAVTPESTKYRRVAPERFYGLDAINGEKACPGHNTGASFIDGQRQQQQMQSEHGGQSEATRTLDSGFIQTRQTWEEDLYDSNAHFEDDVEMENVKVRVLLIYHVITFNLYVHNYLYVHALSFYFSCRKIYKLLSRETTAMLKRSLGQIWNPCSHVAWITIASFFVTADLTIFQTLPPLLVVLPYVASSTR